MWRNFDAYISPDGRVHNNALFLGQQEGVYRFEKCLAEHGVGLGSSASNNPPTPPDTCTKELDSHPGDCWIKLSVWEKWLTVTGFEYGRLNTYEFVERQQYRHLGRSRIRLDFVADNKVISYFDQLYSIPENRTIGWQDAYDLLLRTRTNPDDKDIPELTALYRKHEKLLFSGYLRKFVPPNKVVISELSDLFRPAQMPNETVTITLLGVAADKDTDAVSKFMAALLNVKQCNTLIRGVDRYKRFKYRTEQEMQEAKKEAESWFSPLLSVVIAYQSNKYNEAEYFDNKNQLSGIVLLEKGQRVCLKENGFTEVKLDQLMLKGATNRDDYSDYDEYLDRSAAHDFISLNRYLVANGLRTFDRDEGDPPGSVQWSPWYFDASNPDATPDGVRRILTVGAAQ